MVEISGNAFKYCHGLTAVVLPSSVKRIGMSAFAECDGLREVTLPEGLINIGSWAFYGCTGLTSVTLPASLKVVDLYAFHGCSNLERFDVEPGNTAYSSVEGHLCDVGKEKLFYCPNGREGKVVIPEGMTEILFHAWCALRQIHADAPYLSRCLSRIGGCARRRYEDSIWWFL